MKTDDAMMRFCWIQDLEKVRNVPARDRKGYEMLLSWFDTWRLGRQLPPGRESARFFWKHQILSKLRAEWQVEQWKAAFLKKQNAPAGPNMNAQRQRRVA